MKKLLAKSIAAKINSGDTIGIGTGSTVAEAVLAIGERIREEKILLNGVVSSIASLKLCQENGIKIIDARLGIPTLNWGFDGADSVYLENGICIKGGGAALLHEKIVAKYCKELIILVDNTKIIEDKRSSNDRKSIKIPVEIIPFSYNYVVSSLKNIFATNLSAITLRESKNLIYGPIFTAEGNIILDLELFEVSSSTEKTIKNITGVVESGIFTNIVDEIWVANPTGDLEKRKYNIVESL
jgi:ribose 5-phosphate isomerase A